MTRKVRFGVALFLSLGAGAASAAEISRTFEIDSATLIVFAPPFAEKATDEGSMEAVAHLQFAAEDTQRCMRPKKLKVALLYADVIVIRNGAATESLAVHDRGQALGGILVAPGRKAKLVVSQIGPSTLQQLLPEAAAEYFRAAGCKNYSAEP